MSEPGTSGRRRRLRAQVPRRRDLHVRLTDEEFELVAAAAASEARAVAAWVGATVVRAAASGPGVPTEWRGVLQELMLLRLSLASPGADAAVPEGLMQRIDLLIGKAAGKARRS